MVKDNVMKYKVTAIKPVEILVKMRRGEAHAPSDRQITRSPESFKWIYLNAGDVRDGLDLVLGVMASYVQDEPAQFRMGKQTVLLQLNDKLPKVYYELFELENSTMPD
jgi:hypothetical protein